MSVSVIGTGSYLPAAVVTNDDIEAASSDWDRDRSGSGLHDWMMGRAGVATRHRIAPGEGTAAMAIEAGRRAIADAGVRPEEIDLLILSTFTSDFRLPQAVSIVQRDLGLHGKAIQIEAACAGFIDGCITATALMATGAHRTALVVHSETTSAIVDKELFLCQSLFGDGAGSVVLRADDAEVEGIETWCWQTDGELCDWTFAAGESPLGAAEAEARGTPFLQLQPQKVFPYAVERMVEAVELVLAQANRSIEDIDLLVPHQAGRNILADVAERLKLDDDQVVVTVEQTGNVSGSSVPIALDQANRAGRLRRGDRVVLPAVGGGMAWGALHMTWAGTGAARGAR